MRTSFFTLFLLSTLYSSWALSGSQTVHYFERDWMVAVPENQKAFLTTIGLPGSFGISTALSEVNDYKKDIYSRGFSQFGSVLKLSLSSKAWMSYQYDLILKKSVTGLAKEIANAANSRSGVTVFFKFNAPGIEEEEITFKLDSQNESYLRLISTTSPKRKGARLPETRLVNKLKKYSSVRVFLRDNEMNPVALNTFSLKGFNDSFELFKKQTKGDLK